MLNFDDEAVGVVFTYFNRKSDEPGKVSQEVNPIEDQRLRDRLLLLMTAVVGLVVGDVGKRRELYGTCPLLMRMEETKTVVMRKMKGR